MWCSYQKLGHSMSNGSIFQRLRHDLSQILIKLFQMKVIYEIRLSWKFQHKLITRSKVITPQSWHGKLENQQNKGVQAVWVHFWVSITFFEICCTVSVPGGLYGKLNFKILITFVNPKWCAINGKKISLVEQNQDFRDQRICNVQFTIYNILKPTFLVRERC